MKLFLITLLGACASLASAEEIIVETYPGSPFDFYSGSDGGFGIGQRLGGSYYFNYTPAMIPRGCADPAPSAELTNQAPIEVLQPCGDAGLLLFNPKV